MSESKAAGLVPLPASAWDWSADRLPVGTVGIRLVRIVGDGLRLYEGMRWPDASAVAQFLCQQVIACQPDQRVGGVRYRGASDLWSGQ